MAISLVSTQLHTNDDFTPPASPTKPMKVTHTVDAGATAGIPAAVFLWDTSTQTFSHVAQVVSFDEFPDSYAQAVSDGKPYYRQSVAVKAFESGAKGLEFGAYLWTRLNALVRAYAADDAFMATPTETRTIVA